MRRFAAFCTALFLFVLSGCAGRGPDALLEEIRAYYRQDTTLSMTADITADYGGTVFVFTLLYVGGASGGSIEVQAPDSVAGLRADVSYDGGVTLRYDGAELYTGPLSSDGLSPMDCIPVMLHQWRTGYVSAAGFDSVTGTAALTADFDMDGTLLRTRFDRESFLPLTAELICGSDTVLTCVFRSVTSAAT